MTGIPCPGNWPSLKVSGHEVIWLALGQLLPCAIARVWREIGETWIFRKTTTLLAFPCFIFIVLSLSEANVLWRETSGIQHWSAVGRQVTCSNENHCGSLPLRLALPRMWPFHYIVLYQLRLGQQSISPRHTRKDREHRGLQQKWTYRVGSSLERFVVVLESGYLQVYSSHWVWLLGCSFALDRDSEYKLHCAVLLKIPRSLGEILTIYRRRNHNRIDSLSSRISKLAWNPNAESRRPSVSSTGSTLRSTMIRGQWEGWRRKEPANNRRAHKSFSWIPQLKLFDTDRFWAVLSCLPPASSRCQLNYFEFSRGAFDLSPKAEPDQLERTGRAFDFAVPPVVWPRTVGAVLQWI